MLAFSYVTLHFYTVLCFSVSLCNLKLLCNCFETPAPVRPSCLWFSLHIYFFIFLCFEELETLSFTKVLIFEDPFCFKGDCEGILSSSYKEMFCGFMVLSFFLRFESLLHGLLFHEWWVDREWLCHQVDSVLQLGKTSDMWF